ncbi:MAG: YqgE/AlgH family protein [Acidimicrobiia bacterium]|jgi:putative transcriptional regulator
MDLTGRLLVALPTLTDPNFHRSVVHVLEHGAVTGAVGVIVNRPSWLEVSEYLPELAGSVVHPGVVFIGGPVQREVALTIVRDDNGAPVLIDEPDTSLPCRVFSGYAGWGIGQLEGEIAEGSWHVADPEPDDVFCEHPATLWSDVWRRQVGPLRMLATFPADLRAN